MRRGSCCSSTASAPEKVSCSGIKRGINVPWLCAGMSEQEELCHSRAEGRNRAAPGSGAFARRSLCRGAHEKTPNSVEGSFEHGNKGIHGSDCSGMPPSLSFTAVTRRGDVELLFLLSLVPQL